MAELLQTALKITSRLQKAGFTCYFAGGCVRDQLLQHTPKDYDIATSATPNEILQLFPKADTIGAHFGVVLVKIDNVGLEVATFRTDGSYRDNRRPESVSFSTPEEDALRRDFTINGLFQDPTTEQIIDYVHGVEDLHHKTLRAIGNPEERFKEDALRLLRAIRFATKLDFTIEPKTWNAVIKNAPLIQHISVERVQGELNQILLHPNRSKGLELLVESTLISHIIPEVLDLIGCEQPPQFHPEGDVYTHTRIMLDMLKDQPSLELVLSVLLHDIGKPATYTYHPEENRIRFSNHDNIGAVMAEKILKRLKYPSKVIENVSAMVANHMNFMHVQHMRKAKVKRFMARPTYADELELHRVDCGSSNGITENYDFLKEKEKEFAAEPLIPPPLLTGKDLISYGLKPGPEFSQILKKLQTEQLEGSITDQKQALLWLKKQL